jgi:hypothetical protein
LSAAFNIAYRLKDVEDVVAFRENSALFTGLKGRRASSLFVKGGGCACVFVFVKQECGWGAGRTKCLCASWSVGRVGMLVRILVRGQDDMPVRSAQSAGRLGCLCESWSAGCALRTGMSSCPRTKMRTSIPTLPTDQDAHKHFVLPAPHPHSCFTKTNTHAHPPPFTNNDDALRPFKPVNNAEFSRKATTSSTSLSLYAMLNAADNKPLPNTFFFHKNKHAHTHTHTHTRTTHTHTHTLCCGAIRLP